MLRKIYLKKQFNLSPSFQKNLSEWRIQEACTAIYLVVLFLRNIN